MPTVLLHTCCAPCASVCIERLRAEDLAVTLFFSNANIGDGDEYARRLEAVQRLAEALAAPLLVDETARHDDWLAAVRGLESAREGGARCRPCFAFSLNRTAARAAALGFDRFTTSLTVSPHKHTPTLFELGAAADPVRFLPVDFKRRHGFQRSVELARQLNLYRQDFCGCEFSRAALAQRATTPSPT